MRGRADVRAMVVVRTGAGTGFSAPSIRSCALLLHSSLSPCSTTIRRGLLESTMDQARCHDPWTGSHILQKGSASP
ncbi:hypothetical protein ACFL41_00865 [Gemmatimonadota bacterium]